MKRIFPAISTIPAGEPFADRLAAGLMAGLGEDLGGALLLLPTRRACRAMRDAFLRASGGRALLLPRLQPLGDIDEDGLLLSDEGPDPLDLPPGLPATTRLLQLTRLVLARQQAAARPEAPPPRPDAALRLARDLAAFLDSVQINELSLERLTALAPDDYAEHWQSVLTFLDILRAHWPAYLGEIGALDPAERRNRLLAAQAARWEQSPPSGPVIAAGSTGSIPATARLLGVISRLPRGAIVLPGLDRGASETVWAEIDATHPQDALKRLLGSLKIARGDVPLWPGCTSNEESSRFRLLMTALLPAAASGGWGAGDSRLAIDSGVQMIACASEREEASTVALLLREALEDPDKTAALVTPDRGLARQVAAELRRWDIEIDDSAGQPLALTAPGVFLRLIATSAARGWAPVSLLAVLKHPLAGLGFAPARCRDLADKLDKDGLRGVAPAAGLAGLRAAVSETRLDASALLDALEARLGDFAVRLSRPQRQPFADLLAAHLAAAEALAGTEIEPGSDRLWHGEAGTALATLLADLPEAAAGLPPILPGDYPALFDEMLAGQVVRPHRPRHPRLFIWGPLEARLQQADRMILGGLNEGVWPRLPAPDPWMSRPMRAKFGLPPLERQIGQSAHDFVQAACAREVFLTRAQRAAGTPTVPARWLVRLNTVYESLGQRLAETAADPWTGWATQLDRPRAAPRPASRPRPCPPVAARPRTLAVSGIEQLQRDPYGLYARKILRLLRLDPLEADPTAAERGQAIHAALDDFVKDYPNDLPANPRERLEGLARSRASALLARPGLAAFWWPQFMIALDWIVAREQERRAKPITVIGEAEGAWRFAAPAGDFTLTARADRLELRSDGTVALLDYKTGGVPKTKDVQLGLAPQLPLEGVIAQEGGFAGIPAAPVSDLVYWKIGGAGGGTVTALEDTRELVATAQEGLIKLIATYDDPATCYDALPHPDAAPRYNDYAHLARVAEWLGESEDEA